MLTMTSMASGRFAPFSHAAPPRSLAKSASFPRCYGTQFTSARFIETLHRLGITHRRTAYNHPEGNSYIERFHRSLKEEEVWTADIATCRKRELPSRAGSKSTITTGPTAEFKIALRTRPS
jgi:transposase InsO family protein